MRDVGCYGFFMRCFLSVGTSSQRASAIDVVVGVVLPPFGEAWLFTGTEPHVEPFGAFAPQALLQLVCDAVGIDEGDVHPFGHLSGSHPGRGRGCR